MEHHKYKRPAFLRLVLSRTDAIKVLRVIRKAEELSADASTTDLLDSLIDDCIDAGILEECGSCDQSHPYDFTGDCRDDSNRF